MPDKLDDGRGHAANVMPTATPGGAAIPSPGAPGPFPSPIPTRILHYALAQSFRITSARRNQRVINCYGCGSAVLADWAHEVSQQSKFGSRSSTRFLCRDCFAPVKRAHELVWGVSNQPEWWADLDRAGRLLPVLRSPIPRPGPREIDALLAEREPKPKEDSKP